jgi:peptidoglycan/LPS O-acetylase OafA/YrhL
MAKGKNLQIETLRGLAILLIVMGHVIGSTPEGGMQIDFPSPWRYFYLCSVYIRLPLITAIAGWVYALKPVNKEKTRSFIKTKFARLLLPMFVVGALYYLIQYFTPGTNRTYDLNAIWKILIFPHTYFWYLYSLFVIMLCIALIDAKKWADDFRGWVVCLCVALLLAAAEQLIIPQSVPNLFSLKGALKLLPFFLGGVGINRFSAILSAMKYRKACVVLTVAGLALLQVEWFFTYGEYTALYNSIIPVFILPFTALLIYHTPSFKPLVWIGTFSYTIYLYHGFGTAGGRIILSYFGLHDHFTVFVFASAIAVLGPVVLEKILVYSKPLRFFFLGKK